MSELACALADAEDERKAKERYGRVGTHSLVVLADEVYRLAVEINRLRAALEWYAVLGPKYPTRVAREALGEQSSE